MDVQQKERPLAGYQSALYHHINKFIKTNFIMTSFEQKNMVRLNFHIVSQISFTCKAITYNNTEFGFRMKHDEVHLIFDLMFNSFIPFLQLRRYGML
jgi:hypothetical protein